MNKTLVITTIALVAVVMGFSTIAPVLQQAFAHDVSEAPSPEQRRTTCPDDFERITTTQGVHPDHNFNGVVCFKTLDHIRVVVDDNAGLPRVIIPLAFLE